QLSWNYEKMMAPGFFYTVLPFLKRWYKDEELVEMKQMQSQFFNVNAFDGNFIIGMDLAIEEKQGSKAKETIAGLKTGLMGPLAGVGDTIFGAIIPERKSTTSEIKSRYDIVCHLFNVKKKQHI